MPTTPDEPVTPSPAAAPVAAELHAEALAALRITHFLLLFLVLVAGAAVGLAAWSQVEARSARAAQAQADLQRSAEHARAEELIYANSGLVRDLAECRKTRPGQKVGSKNDER